MWFYRFPAPVVLSVSGKDSARYTHNRLSNDVKGLARGGTCVAGALTAQGRVQALFTVYRVEDDSFRLVADGGEPDTVKLAFTQFLVADRVSVEDISSRAALFHVGVPNEVSTDFLAESGCSSARIHEIRRGDRDGVDILVEGEDILCFGDFLKKRTARMLTDDEYELQRIRGGLPTYPREINETIILTECGRSDVVMFGKGCYVGQEVIEKIDAVGRLPKELKRLTALGRQSFELGSPVLHGGQGVQVGRLYSYAYDDKDDRSWMLAYLKTGQVSAGERVSIGEVTATVVGA